MTIKINKDSWHFKFIDEYSDIAVLRDPNLCTYTKGFIQAMWYCIWGITIVVAFGWVIVDTLMYITFCTIYRTLLEPDCSVLIGIGCITLGLFGAFLLCTKDWLYAVKPGNNLLVEMVRSKFNKFCVKVDFE